MSKERLVELLKKAKQREKIDLLFADIDTAIDMLREEEYIADYLIANGVIVPTYNIGQIVYAVTKGDDLWWKGTVASICYEFNEMSYGISFDDGDFAMFEEECIFPTKEEAEKALEDKKYER